VSGAWSRTVNDMSVPRALHSTVTLADGKVMVLSGYDGYNAGAYQTSVDIYDPTTNRFTTPAGRLCAGRRTFAAVGLRDGRVLVANGYHIGLQCGSRSYADFRAELWSPTTGTWAQTAETADWHTSSAQTFYQGAALLSDGSVLLSGSSGWTSPVGNSERFDPATNTWFPAEPMAGGLRQAHTATVLRDGRVLVAGGTVDAAEIYNTPATGPVATTIGGTVYANSAAPANRLAGARVELCAATCSNVLTDLTGGYSFTGLKPATYTLRVFPPSGSALGPGAAGPITIAAGASATADIVLRTPRPPAAGTTITPSRTQNGVPAVTWTDPLTLRANGCVGATSSTYRILDGATVIRSGPLTAAPPPAAAGTYTATITPLTPTKGFVTVEITFVCAGVPSTTTFDMYIDPSGTVQRTTGAPIAGATVTLLRSDTETGPFTAVPDGDTFMSPSNRSNPVTTDAAGRFGWDVLAGFYRVRASAPGCVAPGSTQTSVETATLTIPPAVTGIGLRLWCDTTPPVSTLTPTPAANANGWNRSAVTIDLTAVDEPDGSGVRDVRYPLTGAQTGGATVAGSRATFSITTEGVTTVSYYATDNFANVETARTHTVRIDKIAPRTTATPSRPANANGWHNAALTVSLTATDDRSGVGLTEYTLDAGPWTAYMAAIAIATEGTHTILYRSTDKAGNREADQSLAIRLDTTAPEGWFQLDSVTTDIVLFGVDAGSGTPATPVAPTTVTPESRTYAIRDRADNTLTIVLMMKRDAGEIIASIVSLQYNAAAVITPARNGMTFEWEITAGSLRTLHQVMFVAGIPPQLVEAQYDAVPNETQLQIGTGAEGDRTDADHHDEFVRPGLILLRMETAAGRLNIDIP
jgi:hypothetical protein